MEPATVVPQSVDLLSAVVLFVAMGLSLVQAPLGDRAARLRVSE